MTESYKRSIMVTFIISMIVMIGTYQAGYSISIDWEVITTGEVLQFPAWSTTTDLATYEITGEKYILSEQYAGSEIKRSLNRDQIMLGLMWLGLCITLAASTYLNRYMFFTVLVLFVLFINRLNLFEVGLFGFDTKMVTLIPFVLFAAPLLIFHEYQKKTHFLIRVSLLVFASLVILFGVEDYPLFTDHIIAHSVFGFSICGLLFLFLISEEIVFGILYMTSSGKGGKNNHIHFSILGLVYLGNLILYYLNKSGLFENSLHFFNPFILLFISGVVSLWSIRFKVDKLTKYASSTIFYLIFLGLGITTMFFLSFHMTRGNDGIYEAFHYYILYFHIGFGVLFFLYVIANFIDPLIRGFDIHKIVYKERNFPYATARLGGLVAILAFYFLSSQESYNLLRSGYFNYLAVLSKTEGNELLAREYTLQASFLGYNTHYANYSLGINEREKENEFAAKTYFLNASQRFPSPYALINYGNLDEQININKVQANYEEALRKKSSGEIKNNLGLLHLRKNNFEEALNVFEESSPSNSWNDAPLLNKWNILKRMEVIDSTTIISDYGNGNFGVKSNILTTQIDSTNLEFDPVDLRDSKILHRQGYLLNSAYLFNHDSIEAILRREISNSTDATTNDRLRKALAVHLYKKGDVNEAFMMLDYLQAHAHEFYKGEYLSAMGKFALDQKAYLLALNFFDRALEVKHNHSIFGKLEALAQLDRFDEIPNFLLSFLKRNPEFTEQANILLTNLESFSPSPPRVRTIPALDSLSEKNLISLGRKNAFHEQQVVEVVNELKKREASGGYEILVDAIEINPYSRQLLETYAFTALDWNLIEYAGQSIERLRELLPQKEFDVLNNRYFNKKQELEEAEW